MNWISRNAIPIVMGILAMIATAMWEIRAQIYDLNQRVTRIETLVEIISDGEATHGTTSIGRERAFSNEIEAR